jgi:hypothetical protein
MKIDFGERPRPDLQEPEMVLEKTARNGEFEVE